MIQPERIQALNQQPARPERYVLYWMQASQRAECNHALEYAIREANERNLPVLAVFGLTENFPEANARHYAFMLQGLAETQRELRERGVQLVVRRQSPDEAALELGAGAALVVTDRGYLRIQKQWRQRVAEGLRCAMVQVESDVIVPVEMASSKEEYAARTIRPRIQRQLPRFLVALEETPVRRDSLGMDCEGLEVSDPEAVLAQLAVSRDTPPVDHFRGGTSEARGLLADFVEHKLEHYGDLRSDPSLDWVSHMSPYLHFGQISPLTVALEVMQRGGRGEEAFLEELIVRRELSMNFVHYNPNYDRYECLPNWARATLGSHAADRRAERYTEEELEQARTADPYWNAAQLEMVLTGKMHNTMRMYWGKKLLEWSPSPEQAFALALRLNNKYELDGRDPNSFAGVAWCFGKHDRPWPERPIFGTVRTMTARGLERKFQMDGYIQRVERLLN